MKHRTGMDRVSILATLLVAWCATLSFGDPPEIPTPSEIGCLEAPSFAPAVPTIPGLTGWGMPTCETEIGDFYAAFLAANSLDEEEVLCLKASGWWCELLEYAWEQWREYKRNSLCCDSSELADRPTVDVCAPEIPPSMEAWCAALSEWVKKMACLNGYCEPFDSAAGCGDLLGEKLPEPSLPADSDMPNAPLELIKELIKEWLRTAKGADEEMFEDFILAAEGGFKECFTGWIGPMIGDDCENPDSVCYAMMLDIIQSVAPELAIDFEDMLLDGEDDEGKDEEKCPCPPCPGPETANPVDLGRGAKSMRYNRSETPLVMIGGRELTQQESDFVRSILAGAPDWSVIPDRMASADQPPVRSGQRRSAERVGRADRAYTSSPTKLTNGILGHNHQGRPFTYVNQGTDGDDEVVKLRGMFATRTFRSSDGILFRSPGPSEGAGPNQDFIEATFRPVGGQTHAVLRHVKADGTEEWFLREWPTSGYFEEEGYVHATPTKWAGLKVFEFDGHAEQVVFEYQNFGSGSNAVPRLIRQVFSVTPDWSATPYPYMDRTFLWNTEIPAGTLFMETTRRYADDGDPRVVQQIKYKYSNASDPGFGSLGDLRQVRVEDFIEDGTSRVKVTQFRYHTGEDEVTYGIDTDGDGYIERGNDHQLKMVIEPTAFEYLVENAAEGYESIDEAANALYTTLDGTDIELLDESTKKVTDLASKLVTRYEDGGMERVLEQFVLQGCGCSAGGTGGKRLKYEYWSYPSPSGDEVSETVRISEHEWLGTGLGALMKVTYNDLTRFGDPDGPASGVNLAIFAEDPVATPETNRWVTHFEYYPSTQLVRLECTPSACASYVPGTPPEGSEPAEPPEYAASITSGLVYAYVYNDWKQRTHVMVGEGDRTRAPPESDNEDFTLVERRVYAATNAGTVLERRSLPTVIYRYRTPVTGLIPSVSSDDVEVTTIEYGFWTAESARLAWMSVLEEAETVAENGPNGSSNTYKTVTIFDEAGRPVFRRDQTGLVTATEYHFRTGAVLSTTVGSTTAPAYLAPHPYDPPGAESWSDSDLTPLQTMHRYNDFGQRVCTVAPDGVVTYHLYGTEPATSGSALDRLTVTTVSFTGEGSSLEFAGPAMTTWLDAEGHELRRSQFAIEAGGSYDTDAMALTGLELSDEVWRSEVDRELGGEVTARRDYLDLPASNAHAEWRFERDARGRLEYQIDPDSSFTHYSYDLFDRITEVRTGVESSGSYGTEYLVSKFVFDGTDATSGEPTPGIGNGRLTHTLAYTGPTDADFRLTRSYFDFRGRVVAVNNAEPPHAFMVYDNQDRMTASATFASLPTTFSPSSILTTTDRGSYAEQSYSQRGLRYRARVKIDPTTVISTSDSSGDFLQSDWWFDGAGRIRATRTPDAPGTKLDLDFFGRPRNVFVTDNNGDPPPGDSGNHAAALSVSDDHVLEQTVNHYANSGRLDFITKLRRTHWAEPSGSSYQGDLDDDSYDWVIRSYTGLWRDSLGRVTRTVDFGTNDSQSRFIAETSAPTWPPTTRPEWSDSAYADARVTATEFNDRGWVAATVDPMGKRTEHRYDAAGRRVAVIENADPENAVTLAWSTNSGGRWDVTHGLDGAAPDVNRTTTYAFDLSSRVIREVAHMMVPDTTSTSTTYVEAVQVTAHDYGVTASSGGSQVTSNRLLAATRYPNSTTGEAGTTSAFTVSFAYNRLGEAIGRTDQNGTVHQLTRDDLGRVTRDDVAAFGSGIDASVTAIATTFDALGRVAAVQSFTGTGGSTLRDEVAYAYTPLGLIASVAQNHDGPTSGTGSSATRTVSYDYREDGMGDGNSSRPTTLTYPDGTTYHYQYGASGSIDDRVSRLAKTSVGSTSSTVAFEWKYLGLAAPVVTTLVEPFVELDRVRARNGVTTTGLYAALDRFGRVTQHRWVDGEFAQNTSQTSYSTIPPIIDLGYTYDSASNITGRYDARVGAARVDRHEEFEIDGLDRVLEAKRGVRTGSSSFSFAPSSQKWTLDALGNWESVKTNANTSGTYAATETREHNLANEIEELDPDGTGSTSPYALTHDDAGNLLTRQISHFGGGTTLSFVHDAWNRLVEVKSNSVSRTKLRYNGLNWLTRRIADFKNSSNQIVSDGTLDQVRVYSYGPDWRMLEQRIYDGFNASTGAYGDESRRALLFQGVGGIDDHLLRQEEQIPSGGGSSTFKKHYLLRDGGRSIIAIVNESGVLAQRVRFDAYGNARHRWHADVDGDGDVDATDRALVSAASNKRIHQSGYNVDADLNRDGIVNSTDLGRVTSSDYKSALRTGLISEPYTSAATGAVDNDIGYSGYVFMVEVGLYHVRFRTYDPILGRWLERDPVGYVDGMSLYLYVRGNPIVGFDPMGLEGYWSNAWGGLVAIKNTLTLQNQFAPWEKSGQNIIDNAKEKKGDSDECENADPCKLGALDNQIDAAQQGLNDIANAKADIVQAQLDLAVGLATAPAGLVSAPIAVGILATGGVVQGGSAAFDFSQGQTGQGAARLVGAVASFGGAAAAPLARNTTVIGSAEDVARYRWFPGYRVFSANGRGPAVDRANAQWLNAAVCRGDRLLAVTNPTQHAARLEGIAPGLSGKSAYLNLELPMLEQFGIRFRW